MKRRLCVRTVEAVLCIGVLSAGCHRAVVSTPVPERLVEEYCWWAVLRTALPPDSVAARFTRAYSATGLTGAGWTRTADTAWAHGGPTHLGDQQYASRVVAYWHGDSTHFRYFVALPDRQTGLLERCTEIARAAAVPTSTPRQPTGEEALPLWTRMP